MTHAEAAWICAEWAGDNELRAWVRGTQSLIARFDGDYDQALGYVLDGLTYETHGWEAAAAQRLRAVPGQPRRLTGRKRGAEPGPART